MEIPIQTHTKFETIIDYLTNHPNKSGAMFNALNLILSGLKAKSKATVIILQTENLCFDLHLLATYVKVL